jgi:hypothetical protein
VLEHIWGGEILDYRPLAGRLHKLQNDTNNSLLKKKLPFAISRPISGCLQLFLRMNAR